MKMKFLMVLASVLLFNGCAIAADNRVAPADNRVVTPPKENKNLPVSYALKGTNTAVVGIAIDEKGFPLETVKAIVLKPGQKVVFAGPDQFQIVFKNKKAPDGKLNYRSASGVIFVEVPKDILEKAEFREEFRKSKSVEFNYAIRINGRELDPPLIIRKED